MAFWRQRFYANWLEAEWCWRERGAFGTLSSARSKHKPWRSARRVLKSATAEFQLTDSCCSNAGENQCAPGRVLRASRRVRNSLKTAGFELIATDASSSPGERSAILARKKQTSTHAGDA